MILKRPGGAVVQMLELDLALVRALDHAAELEHLELVAVATDPALAEHHRPRGVELDRRRDHREEGREHDERNPAPVTSKARLTICDERVISKRFMPMSVMPCRWSSSTEEPATWLASGSTLTFTPSSLSSRITNSRSARPPPWL